RKNMKLSRHFPSLLIIACFLLSACGNIPASPTTETDIPLTPTSGTGITPIELQSGYGVRGAWFELYFTNPASPLSPQGTGGVDGPLVDAIDAARLSIDVATYSFSLNSIRNALLRAHDRGVTVRVVMESTNMDRSDPQILIEAGIPLIGDNRDGLMHDKFIVIDRSEVWMGSMNFTDGGAYDDNNNLFRIHSTKMAENYITEFEEMFVEGKFGDNVDPDTPNPTVTIDDTRMDIYFSPDDGVLAALLPVLEGAQESIYFLAYSFTSNPLGEIVRQKAEAELTVSGVMDDGQVRSNQGTEYDPFRQADLDVRIDGIDGLMHHKVFIVDEKIVVLGSYNFSQAAEERNDENIIIIYNPIIAGQFVEEFQRVYEQAQRND
ncbi:MAG TPA: phospholipase D-like domain-containing protein, partial [Anaerolineales bacterium]|nr:phospholipase D-like domain-containing protein [Anaerolineales bacterium]